METASRFLKKLQVKTLCDPTIPLLGINLKNMKTLSWKDVFLWTPPYLRQHYSEQPRCGDNLSVRQQMHGYSVWHVHAEGIPFIHEKGNFALCDNMDESWGHYAKWNKTPLLDVEPKKAELIEIE